MSDSRISIGYLDKDNIQLDLNRKEGTETISLDDFCTLIERHQWILEEAYEQAREKRIDRVRERHIKEDEEREKANTNIHPLFECLTDSLKLVYGIK